ncbi:hypothetical protein, partial [Herbiconiux daphne]
MLLPSSKQTSTASGLQQIISNMIGLSCKAEQFMYTGGSPKCPKEILCAADQIRCHLAEAATILGEQVNLTGVQIMKDAWFPELKPTTRGGTAEKELSDAIDVCIKRIDAICRNNTYPLAVCNGIAKSSYCLLLAKY